MGTEANVLPFPTAGEKLTYRLPFPSVSEILREVEGVPAGMSHVAAHMQEVAESFDSLACVFEECAGATYEPGTHFYDGCLVFVFHVPRRYRDYLSDLGFEPVEPVEVGG